MWTCLSKLNFKLFSSNYLFHWTDPHVIQIFTVHDREGSPVWANRHCCHGIANFGVIPDAVQPFIMMENYIFDYLNTFFQDLKKVTLKSGVIDYFEKNLRSRIQLLGEQKELSPRRKIWSGTRTPKPTQAYRRPIRFSVGWRTLTWSSWLRQGLSSNA
jgi:hypothetical protein